MILKISKFNILFEYNNNFYVTNTVSKAVIELDSEHRDRVKNKKLDGFSAE